MIRYFNPISLFAGEINNVHFFGEDHAIKETLIDILKTSNQKKTKKKIGRDFSAFSASASSSSSTTKRQETPYGGQNDPKV